MLTHKQKQVLDFIVDYQRDNDGLSPLQPEIQAALGFSSRSRVFYILNSLQERGYIWRAPHQQRGIEVRRTAPAAPIPIYDAATHQIRGYVS